MVNPKESGVEEANAFPVPIGPKTRPRISTGTFHFFVSPLHPLGNQIERRMLKKLVCASGEFPDEPKDQELKAKKRKNGNETLKSWFPEKRGKETPHKTTETTKDSHKTQKSSSDSHDAKWFSGVSSEEVHAQVEQPPKIVPGGSRLKPSVRDWYLQNSRG